MKQYPVGHFEIYLGEHFEKSIEDQIAFFKKHQALILITFEAFWVMVFILRTIAGTGTEAIPQFIYVNF